MTDATPSRSGQINGAGATDAIFLKVFPGEVLKSFDETNVFMPLHSVRSISSGKSAQFPATGKASAAYHVPGAEMLGTNLIKSAERLIYIDGVLQSNVFMADIDDAMSHFDVRGEYAKQLGQALAVKCDRQLAQVGVLTARSSATITGGNGGTAITDADAATNGASLISSIYSAAQAFDEKDVAETDRYVGLRPAQYYQVLLEDKLLDRDFTSGNGDRAMGTIVRAAGMSIVKTNHLPSTNIASAETGVASGNTYHGNFSTTVALAWHKSAFGTVKLMDVTTAKEYQLGRLGTLVVATYAMGHGVLRPECAVEIKSA